MGETVKARVFEAAVSPQRTATWIMQYSPATEAEALKLLRARFPDRPLSLRIAALGLLGRFRAARIPD